MKDNQALPGDTSGFVQMSRFRQRRAQLHYYAGDEVFIKRGDYQGEGGFIAHVDPLIDCPYAIRLSDGRYVWCAETDIVGIHP